MEKLIGRNREIAELERCLSSERSEFVVVSGRRRIGKTFLVNTVLKGRTTMSFVGSHKSPKARQLQKFAQAMQQSALCDVLPQLTSWYDAFDVLEAALSKSDVGIKKVLFFDEMPWIDTPGSEFVAALEDFWNGWASLRDDIMLVACGSATSWLVDQLIENQGGLHNRVTSRIALQPFNLNVTKGIAENVDELFFTPSAKLKGEFGELYQVLFRNSQPYVDIVRQIAMRREGLSRQEIVDATGTSGGSLTKMLANLERCNFIMAQTPLDNKRNGNIYRVCDFYTLFYFRFIEPERQNTLHYWTTKITSPSVSAWQGLTFELIGLLHIDQIRMALGIYGVSVRCSSWRSTNNAEGPGAQIDLVIERADRITHLCEFKFAPDEYVITSDYARRLRERMSVYRSQAKKRNTLLITFVTPFGVSKGKNYSVVQGDITLPQLFAPAM